MESLKFYSSKPRNTGLLFTNMLIIENVKHIGNYLYNPKKNKSVLCNLLHKSLPEVHDKLRFFIFIS